MRKGLLFGTFDQLHYGHLRLFRECKTQCDYLIVLVHSDDYIRKYKKREPTIPEDERYSDVIQSKSVDIALINYDSPRKLWVETLKIDVLFLSEEMRGQEVDVPCEIIYMPRTKGISSTQMRGEK